MKNIRTVLLLGSGALKIGEAGEFDYSGTQAIKALKEEGIRVVLVNPNIATIQTSKGLADEIYFLPVTADFVTRVIEKEKPDGILLSFGGQTALNCGIDLFQRGVLAKHSVTVLGTPVQAILDTEDRKLFAAKLAAIDMKTARGSIVTSVEEGLAVAKELGLPVMLRAGFALGGTGSGVAKDKETLTQLLTNALATTPQVIVEESLAGWKELEYEVVRDQNDNCITVCNMENFDPIGIHTGESIVVAPSQTLSNEEYYRLRELSIRAIRALGIVGECNIQFALNPKTSDYRVIEVNARLSRSSALASKATGYPLAYVAAKLALGKTLYTLPNTVTQKTTAYFEPALDYIVVKIPRWDLEKYVYVDRTIGSEMKSVGEVMSIGRSFEEAIQKGARMLNDGYEGVIDKQFGNQSKHALLAKLTHADTMRLFTICSAFRAGATVKEVQNRTAIDPWFLDRLYAIATTYRALEAEELTPDGMTRAKRHGFSDKQIAALVGAAEMDIRKKRIAWGITPVAKQIDTMAGEFPAMTNYLYMTYNADISDHQPKKEQKVAVIGCGPYAIGTSVEFDWCAVATSRALREAGLKSIMINCNPETVSTDFDHSDYLYFEELTLERVLDIYDIEKSPFVVSVGGQIPNNLAPKLHRAGVPIMGTHPDNLYKAEHRKTFSALLDSLDIAQPQWAEPTSVVQAAETAAKFTYPVLIRPSFVLSGKAMSVIDSEEQLTSYLTQHVEVSREYPLVMSQFLPNAKECDVDGVATDGRVLVYALSEHVEPAGVHSGDSTLMLPSVTFSAKVRERIVDAVEKIVGVLSITGPFNIQFLVTQDTPYVIECNARASRSFPFVSKTYDMNFIDLATRVMLGKVPKHVTLPNITHTCVKVPQFSFHKLRGADPVVHVEMNSTGEVAAFGRDALEAYFKAILATGIRFPTHKAVFLSLGGKQGKLECLSAARLLVKRGYVLYATAGTALFLKENGLAATLVGKVYEGKHPNILDLCRQQKIDFAIVTPERHGDATRDRVKKGMTDGYVMRRLAVDMGIPIFANAQTASMFARAMVSYTIEDVPIASWREYQEGIVI